MHYSELGGCCSARVLFDFGEPPENAEHAAVQINTELHVMMAEDTVKLVIATTTNEQPIWEEGLRLAGFRRSKRDFTNEDHPYHANTTVHLWFRGKL